MSAVSLELLTSIDVERGVHPCEFLGTNSVNKPPEVQDAVGELKTIAVRMEAIGDTGFEISRIGS